MVIVGPEDPLCDGIVDSLSVAGIPTFGPTAKAARIESDKAFAKAFMQKYNVPTARYQSFKDPAAAKNYVQTTGARVIKASGLAAGKGVVVAQTEAEALQAIEDMMVKRIFGTAGDEIVVEELLVGDEVSVFALTDGANFRTLLPAQDHKRAYDDDQGPNTGGMGAYCPYPFIEQDQMKTIERDIIQATLTGMAKEGHPFVGLLYAGLILTPQGPKVIEFNCRFGDPETQSILALLESDLFELFLACLNGTISQTKLAWSKGKVACGVVVASGGYPGSVVKGLPIEGLDTLQGDDHLVVFHSGTVYRDQKYFTNGGRLLTIVAIADNLQAAAYKATQSASKVKIANSFYRKDIAHKAIHRLEQKLDYRTSGVDIEAGNRLVEHIKGHARQTANRSGVMEQIGGFGALFDLAKVGLKDPILVSGTDGVGTKIKIAIETGKLDTIGIDLVAMCVNDIIVQGAEPLFFLDYFACNRLDVEKAANVIGGIAEGCNQAGAALVGGETAEMPGMYAEGDFDLAGFAVGAVERSLILPKKDKLVAGDVIIGLPSSGVHSNGFSLVRKILSKHQLDYNQPSFVEGKTFGDLLLIPTKIYVKEVLPLIKGNLVKALSHITGGGLLENIPRILPEHLGVELDANAWPVLPIFTWLKTAGDVAGREMLRTFNCSLGMVLVINKSDENRVQALLQANGQESYVIGHVTSRAKDEEAVIVHNFDKAIEKNAKAIHSSNQPQKQRKRKRVAVLISGSGTNLQAIIKHTIANSHKTSIDLALVVSDKSAAGGLEFARQAGIPTQVVVKKRDQTREEYDMQLDQVLNNANIEIVCLAGFMRLLSTEFVNRWLGRMINIHPSLLPSFKGLDAYGQALKAKVKVTGCTVHFVTPEMDDGPIIAQKAISILNSDDHDSLAERGKQVEHEIYSQALEDVASGLVKFCLD